MTELDMRPLQIESSSQGATMTDMLGNNSSDSSPNGDIIDGDGDITITVHHNNRPLILTFPLTATVADLSLYITSNLSIPESNQKFLISPKPGLLKPPFTEPTANAHSSLSLASLSSTPRARITLLGSTPAQIASLNASIQQATTTPKTARERAAAGPVKAATPARTRDWRKVHDDTTYTFMTLRPLTLPHLRNPERSMQFLERLRDDPGIRSAMAKHKWSVGLLTEMDPAEHTTQESRTLGLNRNAGEVIELRLRTDAYDGYRDYRTIRRTLCHELTHNVFGEHDARFWALCKEVEKEVERGDWRRGGHSLGKEEYYEPMRRDGEEMERETGMDHGGWTGGQYVLGGRGAGQAGAAAAGDAMSRRDIIAKAAEERAKKTREQGSGS